MRRDIAYFKMASREPLMECGHVLDDLRSTGAQIMSDSLIFNGLTQSFGGEFGAACEQPEINKFTKLTEIIALRKVVLPRRHAAIGLESNEIKHYNR